MQHLALQNWLRTVGVLARKHKKKQKPKCSRYVRARRLKKTMLKGSTRLASCNTLASSGFMLDTAREDSCSDGYNKPLSRSTYILRGRAAPEPDGKWCQWAKRHRGVAAVAKYVTLNKTTSPPWPAPPRRTPRTPPSPRRRTRLYQWAAPRGSSESPTALYLMKAAAPPQVPQTSPRAL